MSNSTTTSPAASPPDNGERVGEHTDERTGQSKGHAILRHIDWIWTIRGSLDLAPGLSNTETFDRLDPLFQEPGTSYTRDNDTLVFTKKDQAAQDKMSVFDAGTLAIEPAETGATLRWRLTSRALLFCFLAPLLFLALSQATVYFGKAPKAEAEAEAGKAGDKTKKPEKKPPELKLHPIDAALGAPAPEKPKKDKKKEEEDKKPSPTPSYVFAGIFAALYIIGRILEAWLVKRLFRNRLQDA